MQVFPLASQSHADCDIIAESAKGRVDWPRPRMTVNSTLSRLDDVFMTSCLSEHVFPLARAMHGCGVDCDVIVNSNLSQLDSIKSYDVTPVCAHFSASQSHAQVGEDCDIIAESSWEGLS